MLIVNDNHRLRAGACSLNDLCPYCGGAFADYLLVMSDDPAQTVYHVACALQLATDLLVDLYTFFHLPAPYACLFTLTPKEHKCSKSKECFCGVIVRLSIGYKAYTCDRQRYHNLKPLFFGVFKLSLNQLGIVRSNTFVKVREHRFLIRNECIKKKLRVFSVKLCFSVDLDITYRKLFLYGTFLVLHRLKEGLSPTTVTTIHNVLHKALDTAMRWGLVSRNVCKLVSPPRRVRYEVHPLRPDQIDAFLGATHGHPLEALFKLAIATGMRRGELMALKWQDIDFAVEFLQVRRVLTRIPTKLLGQGYKEAEPKTEKSRRSIVVADFALEALERHYEQQQKAKIKAGRAWQDHDYVFCTSIKTHLNPTRDILDQFKLLLKKAGLPDIRFHDLRHTAATLLLSLGIHPKVVQEMLGHSQISITMDIYSHVLPTMQRDAINELNEFMIWEDDEEEDDE